MSEQNNGSNEEERIIDELVEVDLPATFEDLCEVEGYEMRVFKVFGFRIENNYTKSQSWTSVVYELIDAVNGEWLEADADDLELLADAEDAEVYMQTIDYENYPKSFMELFKSEGEAVGMAKDKGERKLTAREASAKLAEERKQARKEKYEKTDDLLELLSWVTNMYKKTGERRYKEWSETVKADLANMHPKEGE
jgi:hypothetical protein